jgi:hypothetical protein
MALLEPSPPEQQEPLRTNERQRLGVGRRREPFLEEFANLPQSPHCAVGAAAGLGG